MVWFEKLTGALDDKRRWKEHVAWMRSQPDDYRIAFEAMERYATRAGGIADGKTAVEMMFDLDELMRTAVDNHTPVRDLVGDDPVDFMEQFLDNYRDGQWVEKERVRLREDIARAAG